MQRFSTKQADYRHGASKCNAYSNISNNRADIKTSKEDTSTIHKYKTLASVLSPPTTPIVGHMGMGLVHSITA